MSPRHVVLGAGPVGSTTALLLAERSEPVVVATRSGGGPDHPLVSLVRVDAADADAVTALVQGASTLFNCVNPPYHRWPTDWPPMHAAMMTAAERTGAVLVMMDNLYGFGPGTTMPMSEASPMRAIGAKGAVRRAMAEQLLDAHATGHLRATIARASDFFGPGVRDAALGERVVPRVMAGKSVSVLGRADIPHSSSYMPDVAATLATIATDPRAWGRAWHVPNVAGTTQRSLIEAFARAAGTTTKVRPVPRAALSVAGVFSPMMRGLKETWYQFAEPFVTDSTLTEQTFGVAATPIDEAAAATVAWWRSRV